MPDDAPDVVKPVARRPTLGELLRAKPWLAAPWVALALALPVVTAVRMRRTPVAVIRQLPAFTLTDQAGHAYGSEDLRGHPWIANFIFTSCTFSCPRLTGHMARVQERLRSRGDDGVRMVSFTVDPEVDTPARLAVYAREHGADAGRWHFLTGPMPELQRVSVEGFQIAIGTAPETRREGYNILHGEHIMLVDARGRIRGYYRSTDEGLIAVVRDAETVALEAVNP